MATGKVFTGAGLRVRRKTGREGFTLIELLIVIAVVAVLLAITSPTMRSVIDSVRALKCRHNHRQLITAVGAYAGEWNRWLPFNNWWYWEVTPASPARPGWLYAGVLEDDSPPIGRIEEGALWPYLQSHSLYRCPAHKGPYDEGPAEKLTSYYMTGAVTCFLGHFHPHRIGDIRGDGFCFWEAGETNWKDGAGLPAQLWYGNGATEGLTERHRDGATMSAFDGHTEWVTDAEYEEMAFEDAENRLWCAPCDYPSEPIPWTPQWWTRNTPKGLGRERCPWWKQQGGDGYADKWWGDTSHYQDPYFDGMDLPPLPATVIGRP